MRRYFWVFMLFWAAATAGCANQSLGLWEDPYMQATTGPQPPPSERVSGP